MKIRVKDDDTNINLWLPTNLIFGKLTVKLINGVGRKYAGESCHLFQEGFRKSS